MVNYIARVKLHKASYDDYEQLHGEMENRSFSRTVKGDDGFTYQLPTATYVMYRTSKTLEQACNAAIKATQATGKTHSLIVTDWDSANTQRKSPSIIKFYR